MNRCSQRVSFYDGSHPCVARLRLAGKCYVEWLAHFAAAGTLSFEFLVAVNEWLLGFVTGVVSPVGLHEHGVDLLEIDGFDAVAPRL